MKGREASSKFQFSARGASVRTAPDQNPPGRDIAWIFEFWLADFAIVAIWLRRLNCDLPALVFG